MPFIPSRLSALLLVAGLSTVDLGLLDGAVRSASRTALAQESISLRIRRGGGGVEVATVPVKKARVHFDNGEDGVEVAQVVFFVTFVAIEHLLFSSIIF